MSDIPTPDQALAWLKDSGQEPDMTVTWEVAERDDPVVMNRILDILFSPPAGGSAA